IVAFAPGKRKEARDDANPQPQIQLMVRYAAECVLKPVVAAPGKVLDCLEKNDWQEYRPWSKTGHQGDDHEPDRLVRVVGRSCIANKIFADEEIDEGTGAVCSVCCNPPGQADNQYCQSTSGKMLKFYGFQLPGQGEINQEAHRR